MNDKVTIFSSTIISSLNTQILISFEMLIARKVYKVVEFLFTKNARFKGKKNQKKYLNDI